MHSARAKRECSDTISLEKFELRYGDVILHPSWPLEVLSRIRHIFTQGSCDLHETYELKLVVPYYDTARINPRFDFSFQGCCRKAKSITCPSSKSSRNCSWTVWNTKNRIKAREIDNEKNRLRLREGKKRINTELGEIETCGWKTFETPIDIDDSLGSVYAPPDTTPRDPKIAKSLIPRSWRSELKYLSQEDTLNRAEYDDWKLKNPDVGKPNWDSDSSLEEEKEGGEDPEEEYLDADQPVWNSDFSSPSKFDLFRISLFV